MLKIFWVIFAIYAILFVVLMYLRYKMIFILEEHGVRISKFAPVNTVVVQFRRLLQTQDVEELSPNFKKYAVTIAWTCWYSAMLILVGVFVYGVFLW